MKVNKLQTKKRLLQAFGRFCSVKKAPCSWERFLSVPALPSAGNFQHQRAVAVGCPGAPREGSKTPRCLCFPHHPSIFTTHFQGGLLLSAGLNSWKSLHPDADLGPASCPGIPSRTCGPQSPDRPADCRCQVWTKGKLKEVICVSKQGCAVCCHCSPPWLSPLPSASTSERAPSMAEKGTPTRHGF